MRLISSLACSGDTPNFEPSCPVSTLAWVSASMPGMTRTRTSCVGPGREGRLEPVDVVGTVDDHQPEAVLDRHRDLLVALGVAVQHDASGVDAGPQGGDDLAATGDVETQALLDHHALHGRAREGLRGEDDPAARPALGQPVGVLPGPGAQRVLGHHEHRRADLAAISSSRQPATSVIAVGVGRAPGRQQVVEVSPVTVAHGPSMAHTRAAARVASLRP